MFKSVSPKLDVSSMEENVLKLWKTQDVFKKTIEQRKGKPEYVFYEGPPTANGRPGVHHVFDAFMDGLSHELGVSPTRKPGQSHGLRNLEMYDKRIDTINFAMANDDGMRLDNVAEADIILMGVSRSGKTPTCLYLAMHYGLRAANYPLTDDDFGKDEIPYQLVPFRHKIFALTIDAARLHRVREARRPGSEYASLGRCQQELTQASRIYARLGVPVFDTTSQSIEELAARLVKMI